MTASARPPGSGRLRWLGGWPKSEPSGPRPSGWSGGTSAELGAAPLQAALEALARRGRLELGAGIPVDRTLAGLTPREVEVLRLLVDGRSNRQIAEELFISGKTASVHVTRILAKLNVHSRRDAAAQAHQLGLDQAQDPGQP